MIIGLTGPSGAGKSTVASFFEKKGYRIIDCDGLVHELDRNADYLLKIKEAFGAEYITSGAVDRKKLAGLVFSDGKELDRLNRLIAPMIYKSVMQEIESARQTGENAVVDAPLLFEYALESVCDVTVGVIADRNTAIERLAVRDGRSKEELAARRSFQHDDTFFVDRCDFVIRNDGDRQALFSAFSEIFDSIEKRRSS